jgi:hypothetical protein
VVGIGGQALDAVYDQFTQGEDVRVNGFIGFDAHRFALGHHTGLIGRGYESGRSVGESHIAAGRLNFGLERITVPGSVIDQGNKAGRVEIHIGQGRKNGFIGELIDGRVADIDLGPFHRHLGDPLYRINEKVLESRHLGLLAAHAYLGASFAFCRLLTLKTKHGFSS